MKTCRSCQAPIIWTVTENNGKRMPVDAYPYEGDDPRGLFVLRHPRGYANPVPPIAMAVTPDAFPDEPKHTSHFATCPQRDEWRK